MQLLKNADIPNDDISYIVYLADNIASAADRRKNDTGDVGFELSTPLQSVFNILNDNHEEKYYRPRQLDPKEGINYPQEEKKRFDETFYEQVRLKLTENLKGLEWNQEYINSLLSVLEANLTYVPSSTAKGELADISLYDHVKITAAISSCIDQYLREKGITDYKKTLFKNSREFYTEDSFFLYSMDISGIQDFIYTITSKNALRTLRARSFYLEIMMEHIIDGLLDRLNLSRANLIYSGGGHCYLLIPNTEMTRNVTDEYLKGINQWFLEKYKNSLYIAGAGVPCSGNSLKNEPQGSYSKLYKKMSAEISRKKSARYTAEDIIQLNKEKHKDYSRECKVCKNIGNVDNEGICSDCRNIEEFSKHILYNDFFTVLTESDEKGLPLPQNCVLVSDSRESVKKRMTDDPHYVRTYSKNTLYTGKHVATKLWVGDYTTGNSMEEFSEQAEGIKRIGVLRADVDNLGSTIAFGFPEKYATLSRSATLSRHLSLFFKLYMNQILEKPKYQIHEGEKNKRFATIVYSGGDDVFIVGSWNEAIELATDIRRALKCYTQNTLTISAGIGVYGESYPISAIADEVANMEDKSKDYPGKNAVTIFEDGEKHEIKGVQISDGTYPWSEFEDEVIGEKMKTIGDYLEAEDDKGNSFLYRLLELIRSQKEKINFARCVYMLSRLEPERGDTAERKEAYQIFSQKMYQWIKSEKDCRQLKTAINLYVYLHRKTEEERG